MAYTFTKLEKGIRETEEWLSRELQGIRAGRAAPALLDSVRPEAYGAQTPLAQLASVTVEDARTIRIIPWDKSIVKTIEKAIVEADLGISVGIDDQGLRISFPELSAERRTLLIKLAGEKLETARVTLRSHRTDALKELDAAKAEGGIGDDEVDRFKKEIQKKIDAANTAFEALEKKKETEVQQ